MKKILLASLFAASAFGLGACNNGDYDVNPAVTANGTNPLNTGNGGNGGGGGSSNFNWSGSDPMSAKVDGTAWQGSGGSFQAVNQSGVQYDAVQASGPNSTILLVTFPHDASAGSSTSMSSANYTSFTWTPGDLSSGTQSVYSTSLGGGSGAVKILENDATHVKGLFYGVAKDLSGKTVNMTEGYFNVKK